MRATGTAGDAMDGSGARAVVGVAAPVATADGVLGEAVARAQPLRSDCLCCSFAAGGLSVACVRVCRFLLPAPVPPASVCSSRATSTDISSLSAPSSLCSPLSSETTKSESRASPSQLNHSRSSFLSTLVCSLFSLPRCAPVLLFFLPMLAPAQPQEHVRARRGGQFETCKCISSGRTSE